MSWETNLFCNVSFNCQTYNSIDQVGEALEALNENITEYKETLRDLALMTEPEKFREIESFPNNYVFIKTIFKETLESLEYCLIERYKLELLKENWDYCHNSEGLAIAPPSTISWDTAYLDGDFIKTNECNGKEY